MKKVIIILLSIWIGQAIGGEGTTQDLDKQWHHHFTGKLANYITDLSEGLEELYKAKPNPSFSDTSPIIMRFSNKLNSLQKDLRYLFGNLNEQGYEILDRINAFKREMREQLKAIDPANKELLEKTHDDLILKHVRLIFPLGDFTELETLINKGRQQ